MRFFSFLVCILLGFGAQAQNLADTQWQLYPGAGALGVGPGAITSLKRFVDLVLYNPVFVSLLLAG